MTLVEKIKASITGAGYTCYYHSQMDLNRILDSVTFPTTLFYLVRQSNVEQIGSMLLESASVQILFTDTCDLDFDATTLEETKIDQCKQRALAYIRTLYSNTEIDLLKIENAQRVYCAYDVNVCGYMVTLKLREVMAQTCESESESL